MPTAPLVWEVTPDFPAGHARAMTTGELAQWQSDQDAGATVAAQTAASAVNAALMRQQLAAHLADALTLADAIDANTATPAQQRQGLSLCLRGTTRLARLVLELYDQAA